MERQQRNGGEKRGKVDLRLKRRLDNTFRARVPGRDVSLTSGSAGGVTTKPAFPRLPASRLAASANQSIHVSKSDDKERKTLMEILAEREERETLDMKWCRLPPPNVERYIKKPVVLLEWDETLEDGQADCDGSLSGESHQGAAIDVDTLSDDDSLLDISHLTATLENAERELSFLEESGLQDKEIFDEFCDPKEGPFSPVVMERENEYVPTAPCFNEEDDDDYGDGSDMDLFGDEDLDRLYDNVDRQLQQHCSSPVENSSVSSPGNQSMDDVVILDDSPPTVTRIQPSSPKAPPSWMGTGDDKTVDDESNNSIVPPQKKGGGRVYETSSTTLYPRGGPASFLSSGKVDPVVVEREEFSAGTGSAPDAHAPRQPPVTLPVALVRTYSSESKHSPDSDDLDLPPVDWGKSVARVVANHMPQTTSRVKDEPKAHSSRPEDDPKPCCSKDLRENSPPCQSNVMVAENCPVCNISFPKSYTQLEVDEHVAVCLSAMDFDDDDDGW